MTDTNLILNTSINDNDDRICSNCGQLLEEDDDGLCKECRENELMGMEYGE